MHDSNSIEKQKKKIKILVSKTSIMALRTIFHCKSSSKTCQNFFLWVLKIATVTVHTGLTKQLKVEILSQKDLLST